MCLGMDFFGFILFESAHLTSVGLCLVANWGSFELLFLQVLFQHLYCLSFHLLGL